MKNNMLRTELTELSTMLDDQIEEVYFYARRQRITPASLQNTDGSFVLAPLLTAKAQVVCTLAWLDKAEQPATTINGQTVWPKDVCPGAPRRQHHRDCRLVGDHDPHQM